MAVVAKKMEAEKLNGSVTPGSISIKLHRLNN
jgi:hypothetical protein